MPLLPPPPYHHQWGVPSERTRTILTFVLGMVMALGATVGAAAIFGGATHTVAGSHGLAMGLVVWLAGPTSLSAARTYTADAFGNVALGHVLALTTLGLGALVTCGAVAGLVAAPGLAPPFGALVWRYAVPFPHMMLRIPPPPSL